MIKEKLSSKVSICDVNPLIPMDYPDPDVIRVDDTYYMASTTMHFFPGCEILRSYDLLHWEHAAYVYDNLDSTTAQRLENGENIYGKGMWAPSLRRNNGCFYLSFCANDTGKTYLYTSEKIEGPWEKHNIEGFYHDGSILFDEDRVFIAYGNREIKLTELDSDLSGPKEGGLNRTIIKEENNNFLSYEGCHLYKIHDKYFVFLIHSRPDRWMRTQCCFWANSLEGDFRGGEILCEDMGYFGQGVAQGGIVDTPDGRWFAVLFQDRGGVGRTPVLLPLRWKNGLPIIEEHGNMPLEMEIKSTRPDHEYLPLAGSDDFSATMFKAAKADNRRVTDPGYDSFGMRSFWQFNHEPELDLISQDVKKRKLLIKTGEICQKFDESKNTLTQRMTLPRSRASVIVDGQKFNEGDRAGIAILCENYLYLALEKTSKGMVMVLVSKEDNQEEELWRSEEISENSLEFRIDANTFAPVGNATVFYRRLSEDKYHALPFAKSLKFTLGHFVGCRFALFCFSTQKSGGTAAFSNFKYEVY